MKIIKTSGFCSDGCQWQFCDFWQVNDEPTTEVIDGVSLTRRVSRCTMFGNTEIYRGSLVCCNKIYGHSYEGNP